MTTEPTARLNDYIARLLIRYFRVGQVGAIQQPDLSTRTEGDLLRLHWAISPKIVSLCKYLSENRHQTQVSLQERERRDDAVIRGRLLAGRTVVERAVSGHPTRVVFMEPVKSYSSGPNHVLIWTLQHAYLLARRLASVSVEESTYAEFARSVAQMLNETRKIEMVSRAILETDYTSRPSPRAVGQAGASRRPLYRKAYEAYRSLQEIERGHESEIEAVLRATLVAPLERWRAFELALALGMANALASALDVELQISNITPTVTAALLEAGPYLIFWQSRTSEFVEPEPEPSERLVAEILEAHGMSTGADRPDVVVMEKVSRRVIAIGEAKYFDEGSEAGPGALRDAATQLVRYARGFAGPDELRSLTGRSLIVLWKRPAQVPGEAQGQGVPIVADFEDLTGSRLGRWADRVVKASD